MVFISLTRLRLRGLRFLPLFAIHAFLSRRQLAKAPGFLSGALLPDKHWTFWTLTAWDSQESMRRYMVSGAHQRAMPHLMNWCDEASVAHWTQQSAVLPPWTEADRRMRETGRPSKVRRPSANHLAMTFAPPQDHGGSPVAPSTTTKA